VTRARLVLGRRLSGECSGGCGRPIGEEIGYRSRHCRCFFNTARSDGMEFREEGELGGGQRTEGRKEARF
jgi:hypothetical protein